MNDSKQNKKHLDWHEREDRSFFKDRRNSNLIKLYWLFFPPWFIFSVLENWKRRSVWINESVQPSVSENSSYQAWTELRSFDTEHLNSKASRLECQTLNILSLTVKCHPPFFFLFLGPFFPLSNFLHFRFFVQKHRFSLGHWEVKTQHFRLRCLARRQSGSSGWSSLMIVEFPDSLMIQWIGLCIKCQKMVKNGRKSLKYFV